MEELCAVLIVALSPAVGSFLGVLVDRLPAGEDVIRRPSACASCGTRLGWSEMVPVLSWLAARGRCRHCGAAIPGHLLRIELLAVAAGLAAVALGGSGPEMALRAAYLWVLIALFYCDVLTFRLPDPLTVALAALGLGLAAVDPGRSVWVALATGLGAMAAFWAIRVGYRLLRGCEGLGLGDVKLAAGLGAGLGPYGLPLAVLVAAVLALAAAMLGALRSGHLPGAKQAVPFGAALAAGAALVLIFAPEGRF